jgi:hypothetical protein
MEIIDFTRIFEQNQKSELFCFYNHWLECEDDERPIIYNFITSFIRGDIDKSHTISFILQVSDTKSDVSIMIDDWLSYIEKTQTICYRIEILKTIIYEIKNINIGLLSENRLRVIYGMMKKIWSFSGFRKLIKHIRIEQSGFEFVSDGIFSAILTTYSKIVNYDDLIDSVSDLISDHTIHEDLINMIWKVFNLNQAYTYDDINHIQNCSSYVSNNFLFRILTEISYMYGFNKIIREIKSDVTNYNVKDYQIQNLPLLHKLYMTILYGIPICHSYVITKYCEITDQLTNMSYMLTTKLKSEQKFLIKIMSDRSKYLIQNIYTAYGDVYDRFGMVEVFNDILNYIDRTTSFLKSERFYGDLPKQLLEYVPLIIGGYKNITNQHIRFNAMEILNKLLPINGFKYFGDIFTNIFKYINEVDFFKWSSAPIATKHHKHIIQTFKFLLDFNLVVSAEQSVIAGTTYNILKRCFTMLEMINNMNNQSVNIYYDIDAILLSMFDIISISLLVYQQIYANNLITNKFKEVDQKYVVLIQKIISLFGEKHYVLYRRLHRKDIAKDIINIIYDTIYLRIDSMIDVLFEYKDIIIDTAKFISSKKKNIIISKLSEYMPKSIELPEQFMDPITCVEISEPIMIPDSNLVYDAVSILTQIRENGCHPINRKPFSEKELSEYNEILEIKLKLEEFNAEKKKWLDSNQ